MSAIWSAPPCSPIPAPPPPADPRGRRERRGAARVFQRAGLDVAILYDEERNAGTDVRRVGEEGLFEMLREKNLQGMAKAEFRRVVTTDPHTYHALRNEY